MSEAASNAPSQASERWISAYKVVKRQKSTRDFYGEFLTDALNRSPEFTFDNRETARTAANHFIFPPFISKHNLDVFCARFRILFVSKGAKKDHFRSNEVEQQSNNTAEASVVQAVGFSMGSFFVMVIACLCLGHVIVGMSARTIWSLFVSLLLVVVDLQELKEQCPSVILTFVEQARMICKILDNRIMQGRRFAGREWNADRMAFVDQGGAKSWSTRLLDLPPPTINEVGRERCLDRQGLSKPQWGHATVSHHVGINFCFVMLEEDQRRKAARRKGTASTRDLEGEKEFSCGYPRKDSVSENLSAASPGDWSIDTIGESRRKMSDAGVTACVDTINEPVSNSVETKRRSMSSPLPTLRNASCESVILSPCTSEGDEERSEADFGGEADLPWIDVGAKIGMRLLNSTHVQRAMATQEAKKRFAGKDEQDASLVVFSDVASTIVGAVSETGATIDPDKVMRPVHSMWTSPTAAAVLSPPSSDLDSDSGSVCSDIESPAPSCYIELLSRGSRNYPRPPLSPRSAPDRRRESSNALSTTDSEGLDHDGVQDSRPTEVLPQSPLFRLSPKKKLQISETCSQVKPEESSLALECYIRDEQSVVPLPRTRSIARKTLDMGVKVAVSVFPNTPQSSVNEKRTSRKHYQMGTVIHSERILVEDEISFSSAEPSVTTNCLSVTVQMDKSFLRNGEFARLTFRVRDSWSPRYMPKHSAVPIGSCVSTVFGIGILVGWRVEDDIHVVGSLWQRRRAGSARSYLNRNAILGTIEAAIGFQVQTRLGSGVVSGFVGGSVDPLCGKFLVDIGDSRDSQRKAVEMNRGDIYSCHAAQFMPVIEHIREAANFQLQLDNYEAALRAQNLLPNNGVQRVQALWAAWSDCGEIFWKSFLKAVDEDNEFDHGVNEFMADIISFLERLDDGSNMATPASDGHVVKENEIECVSSPSRSSSTENEPGFWILNDILGDVFGPQVDEKKVAVDTNDGDDSLTPANSKTYAKIFGVLNTLMKTVSISKAASTERPHFRLALAIAYDFLLFVRTLVKVQRKNVSSHSLMVWKRALTEISTTFGPIKDRLQKIGMGIAQRMEKQGRKAKIRTLKLVDAVLGDDRLLFAIEQGDWNVCATRIESALIKSEVVQDEHRQNFRKTVHFLNDQLLQVSEGGTKERNNAMLSFFTQLLQCLAAPRRSALKIFTIEGTLEFFERILVRVFEKEERASRMLTIHASHFHSLRHFRLLKDFSTSGHIWIPLLDAADAEFSWIASRMPENAKEIMCPLSSLFSLCVAQFHKIYAGHTSSDWLDFLFEEDAVRIIHDIDIKLIIAVESFSKEVKAMVSVVPYYANIDDDVLGLFDELNIDEFLKEMFEAIDHPHKVTKLIREKTAVAMERFLNYLPKMSIPVERRDLGDGWVLTCRGEHGGDLSLSDVSIGKENVVCRVIGSELLYLPDSNNLSRSRASAASPQPVDTPSDCDDEPILEHIREMILQARTHGCWRKGIGGIDKPPSDPYVCSVLQGLPVSSVLDSALDLWCSSDINDDELLEIAIRDVSYQIQVHETAEPMPNEKTTSDLLDMQCPSTSGSSDDSDDQRFNPRIDPTVLYLEMNKLTLTLDNFSFRIEKTERTIFDPVFNGRGTLSIHNVTMKVRVECAKERQVSNTTDFFSPIFRLGELEIDLERVRLQVKDTGLGSDWIVNRAVEVFEASITRTVEENLKLQIRDQINSTIESLNDYFQVNPKMVLNVLGIAIDDLDEHVVFV